MRGLRSFGVTLAGNFIQLLFIIAHSFIIARALGPEGRGELAALVLVPVTLPAIAGMGMPAAIVYFGARAPKQLGEILGTGIIISLIGIVLLALPAMAIHLRLINPFGAYSQTAGLAFLINAVITILFAHVWYAFQATHGFVALSFLKATPQMAYMVVALAVVAGLLAEVGDIVFGYLAVLTLFCLSSSWIAYGVLIRQPLGWSRTYWRDMLRYGLPVQLGILPVMLAPAAEQMMVATHLSSGALGFFAAAMSWAQLLRMLAISGGTVLAPRLAGQDGATRTETLERGLRLMLVLLLCGGLALWAVTPIAIPLIFGHSFEQAVPTASIMLLSGLLAALVNFLDDSFRSLGRTKTSMIALISGFVCTMAAMAVILPQAGVEGAAWASAFGNGVALTLMVAFVSRICSPFRRGWTILFIQDIKKFSHQLRSRQV